MNSTNRHCSTSFSLQQEKPNFCDDGAQNSCVHIFNTELHIKQEPELMETSSSWTATTTQESGSIGEEDPRTSEQSDNAATSAVSSSWCHANNLNLDMLGSRWNKHDSARDETELFGAGRHRAELPLALIHHGQVHSINKTILQSSQAVLCQPNTRCDSKNVEQKVEETEETDNAADHKASSDRSLEKRMQIIPETSGKTAGVGLTVCCGGDTAERETESPEQTDNGNKMLETPFYPTALYVNAHTRGRGKGPFQCPECSEMFRIRRDLNRHLRRHESGKHFHCAVCGASFPDSYRLTVHIRIHTGEKPFECTQCDAAFADAHKLKVHIRTHTGDKPYKCVQCEAAFTTSQGLRLHVRTHTGEKPYHCSLCPAAFARSYDLTKHTRVHTGVKPYQCSECSMAFTQPGKLKEHARVHTGERPFHCSECSSSFRESSKLRIHMRVHTGEKPYQCAECPSAFAQLSGLKTHQRIHSGERPYQCELCPKAFTTSSAQKVHMERHLKPSFRPRDSSKLSTNVTC